MTTSLVFYGALGVASTAVAFVCNRHLFVERSAGRVSALEGLFYFFGIASLCARLVLQCSLRSPYPHTASYINYTKALFSNWASDSAAQDYTMVNLVLLPLWTIVDGRRRGLRAPWIFFVMSLFTSLAFAMAFYLAFVERQVRYKREVPASSRTA